MEKGADFFGSRWDKYRKGKRGNISVAEYIETGLLDARTFAAKSGPKDLFELVRKEDIDFLRSVFPIWQKRMKADGNESLYQCCMNRLRSV